MLILLSWTPLGYPHHRGWTTFCHKKEGEGNNTDQRELNPQLNKILLMEDFITWHLHSSGIFSVRSMYSALQPPQPKDIVAAAIWATAPPLEVQITMWLALLGRLPISEFLAVGKMAHLPWIHMSFMWYLPLELPSHYSLLPFPLRRLDSPSGQTTDLFLAILYPRMWDTCCLIAIFQGSQAVGCVCSRNDSGYLYGTQQSFIQSTGSRFGFPSPKGCFLLWFLAFSSL